MTDHVGSCKPGADIGSNLKLGVLREFLEEKSHDEIQLQ